VCLTDLDVGESYDLGDDNVLYKGVLSDDNDSAGKLLKNRK